MGTDSPGRRTIARLAIAVVAALAVIAAAPGVAGAASIAYIDGGEIWLSSLDGQQKVRLATPVVNSDGETEKWLAVAASDRGRIVAVRNVPGRSARLSLFKVWEPNGASTIEGPLNAPSGWAVYVYPLGFDVTADGTDMVYGYLNKRPRAVRSARRPGDLCPACDGQFTQSDRRLRPGGPNAVRQQDHRPHWRDSERAGRSGAPYGTTFTPWIDLSGIGLDLRRTDVAANGQLAAFELEHWNGGTQRSARSTCWRSRGSISRPQVPAAVDCFVPTDGFAKDVSLSLDATRIAWTDAGGLKVAGAPTTAGTRASSPRRPS